MKDAKRIVRDYALRSISDDYESLGTILGDVVGWTADSGIEANRDLVLAALAELVREGYAQAYRFEPPFKEAIHTEYSPELADDLWFYITSKGKQLASDLQKEWR